MAVPAPRAPSGPPRSWDRWGRSCGDLLTLTRFCGEQCRPECGQAAMDMGLDGAFGPADGRRDLGVRHPVDVAQDHCRPLRRAELAQETGPRLPLVAPRDGIRDRL